MEVWAIIVILFAYFFVEIFVSIFFNFKVFMITKENFKIAAINGALATFLYSGLMALSAFVAIHGLDGAIWFIFASAFMMALGNFFATLMVPKIHKIIKKEFKKKKNQDKNIKDKNQN